MYLQRVMQVSSTAVSPFFVEDVHELQLNSLKLISVVRNVFFAITVNNWSVVGSSVIATVNFVTCTSQIIWR